MYIIIKSYNRVSHMSTLCTKPPVLFPLPIYHAQPGKEPSAAGQTTRTRPGPRRQQPQIRITHFLCSMISMMGWSVGKVIFISFPRDPFSSLLFLEWILKICSDH